MVRQLARDFSLEEMQEVEKMIQSALPAREIATKLNRNQSTIHAHIKRNGGRHQYSAKSAYERNRVSRVEGRRKPNFISPETKKSIEELFELGCCQNEISRKLRINRYIVSLVVRDLKIRRPQEERVDIDSRMDTIEARLDIIMEMLMEKK